VIIQKNKGVINSMKKQMIIKMILLSLLLFVGKMTALAQNTDIKCEVSGLNLNLSQDDPSYGFKFGSFYLFADGKEVKEEKGGVVITKFYKLPRTELILSVAVAYSPKGEMFGEQSIMQQMVLGKKRFPFFSDSKLDEFFDGDTKHAVSDVSVVYSVKAFDKGNKGALLINFLGKKKPIQIAMTCKKEGS